MACHTDRFVRAHTIKSCTVPRVVQHFLHPDTRLRCVARFTPRHINPGEKLPLFIAYQVGEKLPLFIAYQADRLVDVMRTILSQNIHSSVLKITINIYIIYIHIFLMCSKV
jgi:hypothetical protein